jgi:hypothetical protein
MKRAIFQVILYLLFGCILNAQILEIAPEVTHPAIKINGLAHRIYFSKNIAAPKRLLIYLPAFGYNTNSANQFCQFAAAGGYHTISLAYLYHDLLHATCEHSTRATCFEEFHLEMIEGKNYSALIQIDTFNSLIFRIRAVIQYLLQQGYTDFEAYLNPQGALRLDQISFAGHLDAAGIVARMAKKYPVQRAIFFSGPRDFSLHYYLPPEWMSTRDWKTERSKLFAFAHQIDEKLILDEIYDSLGLKKFGPPKVVEKVPKPYDSTRILLTSFGVPAFAARDAPIIDAITPSAGGKAIFEPVWSYLLGTDLNSSVRTEEKTNSKLLWYPNPAPSNAIIRSQLPIKDVLILDLSGKKIIHTIGSTVNLASMSPGTYLIRCLYQDQYLWDKILVY